MGKGDKVENALEAQRTVMHRTGHVAFTHQQSEVLKQLYKTENRAQQRRRKEDSDQVSVTNPELNESIQNPMTPEDHNVLFEGTSREGGGRAQYLKLQAKKGPKDRFRAPVTSAHTYGWDIDLSRYNASHHSRKAVLRNTCERPRGVFNPDLS
eukprot:TRINITY_DN4438_c0_g1_i1.p1 TRINITY_DN4438_c0_g1~~TRINITY_DN4438_c0_g1_i1.p1  ORF type:complete len:153 (+),score=3.78 TRINITY_DN4438_c0_g1_i1:484-942(+)